MVRHSVRLMPLIAFALAAPAYAGPYSDDLSKCMVEQASAADRTAFVKWMFTAMAASPVVKDMAKVTPDERKAASAEVANFFTRLMTKSCRSQVVAALRYEGDGAVMAGFSLLGKVAMQDLMTDPAVLAEYGALDGFEGKEAWDGVTREAGLLPAKK